MPSASRAVLVFLLVLISLPAAVRARPSALPDLVAIGGAVPALIEEGLAPRLATLPPSRGLPLAIDLASRDQTGLNRMIQEIYDPRSPLYHHYMTPAAFNARFGPDPGAVQALRVWLAAQGLQVGPWQGGFVLPVTGDVAHIDVAFHMSMQRFRLSGGTRFAPASAPLLPRTLAPVVHTILGLTEMRAARSLARAGLPPTHSLVSIGAGRAARGPGGGYAPSEVASAYDFTPIYAGGYRGEHMRVALVELAPYQLADVNAYAAQFGIPEPAINSIPVAGGNAREPAEVEATLDIEQLLAGAPGAVIDVYNAPNDPVHQVEAYTKVASAGNADVLSLQWVNCEPAAADVPGFIDTQHSVFQQLAAQGTTVVGATGDYGAYGCDNNGMSQQYSGQLAVDLPASDPLVLAVGASDLALTTSNRVGAIGGESAWSCPPRQKQCVQDWGPLGGGSGGGLSEIFRPGDRFGTGLSWQTGPGVSNSLSTGARQVPDVVLSGATQEHQYSTYWQGQWKLGGGSSAAAPLWAALLLLTDQYLKAQGLPRLGWVNPLVYQLGATVQTYPAYHDITSGNNLFYSAGPGWDYATGWGSPNAWNFLRDAGAFEQAIHAPVSPTPMPSATGTATAIPLFSATATPSAPGTVSTSPTSVIWQAPTATIGFPSPTRDPSWRRPTPTPSPISTPLCAGTGIANGSFQSGSLACWHASGAPSPRVGPSMHAQHRFSVQLGSTQPGAAGSELSQTFALPSGLARPRLHIGFWLSRSVSSAQGGPRAGAPCARGTSCARPAPVPPVITLRDQRGHMVLQQLLVPHRDRAWSGLALPLPARTGRLTLTIQVPRQPSGASEVLLIDDVYIGT